MTNQGRSLLKACHAAFRSGDRALCRAARANLKRGIKKAESDHKRNIESHLSSHSTREVWQEHKTSSTTEAVRAENLSVQPAEEINSFFARFETSQQQHSSPPALLPSSSSPGSCTAPFTVTLCQTCAPSSEPQEGCRSRRTWQGAESVCPPAHPHLHQNLQPLTGSGSHPILSKISHNHPSAEEVSSSQPDDYRPVALTTVIM